MRFPPPLAVLVWAILPGAALAAPCRSMGSPTAVALPALSGMSQAQIGVAVSAPLMLKLMKVDEAAVRRAADGCTRSVFQVEGLGAYRLTGEDEDKTFPRRALPQGGRGPLAFLSPVSDLQGAIAQSKGAAAPPVFYVLATARDGVVEGFRLYDAVPDDARLQADVVEALSGGLKPFFRLPEDGRFQLLVN